MLASDDHNQLERELVSAAEAREVLTFDGDARTDDPQGWGPERTIRADVLSKLLTASDRPTLGSIRLRGCRITGQLDLEGSVANRGLFLTSCLFEEPIDVTDAYLATLALFDCRLPSVMGARLEVKGNLQFDGSILEGELELYGAKVGGHIGLTSTCLDNDDGWSLMAEELQVHGAFAAPKPCE